MTDYTDLIARLGRGLQWADDGWPVPGTSDDMQAAAAAIEQLEAEVEKLQGALKQAGKDLDEYVGGGYGDYCRAALAKP